MDDETRFDRVTGPQREEIDTDAERVEALTLLDEYGLGKAVMLTDPPPPHVDTFEDTQVLSPDAYVLPYTVDHETTEETEHLVLCKDGRMLIVTKPTDNAMEIDRYMRYFVRNPQRLTKPNVAQEPESFIFFPQIKGKKDEIGELINLYGWPDAPHGGFITAMSTSSSELPSFPTRIMQAVEASSKLAGVMDSHDRELIREKVLDVFAPGNPEPPAPAESPSVPQT